MLLSVNMIKVSGAPLSPYIMVIPEKTVDPTIEPGINYTVSVYSNYTGNDVWGWEFSLSFNPAVLQMGFDTADTWIGDGARVVFMASRAAIVPYSEKIYLD